MSNKVALAKSSVIAAGTLAVALLMIAPGVNFARAESRSNFTPIPAEAAVQLVVATPSLSSQFKRLRSHKKLAACKATGVRCSSDDECCDPYICEFNVCW